MKTCAIITPGFLPVPALLGGAVEVLIEELIMGNEQNPKFVIDLYTIEHEKLNQVKYDYCNIIQLPLNPRYRYKLLKKAKHFVYRKLLGNNEYMLSEFGLEVSHYMSRKKYDYVIIENNAAVFNSLKLCDNMIFHLHNNLDGGRPNYIVKKIIKNCKCTLSVSKYIQNEMNYVLKSRKNKVLCNCVDLKIFSYKNVDNIWVKKFKKDKKIKDQDFVFYYSGRICKEKGVLELIKAFIKIAEEKKNVKLIIVGNSWFGNNNLSDYEKELYLLSKNYSDKIIFTGFICHNFIPNILSIASCVVIPSKWEEPFGIVALEAMAMSKAIIGTISGGLTEVLEGCSILIEKDDNFIDELYNQMLRVMNDKRLRKNLEALSYKKLLKKKEFNSENYFNNFIKIIEEENEQ